jgi:hypothetical protein
MEALTKLLNLAGPWSLQKLSDSTFVGDFEHEGSTFLKAVPRPSPIHRKERIGDLNITVYRVKIGRGDGVKWHYALSAEEAARKALEADTI